MSILWGILAFIIAGTVGFILGRITQYDPEVEAKYKHEEAFKKYTDKLTRLLKVIDHDHVTAEGFLKLDGLVILSAYDRSYIMKQLQGQNYKFYNIVGAFQECYSDDKIISHFQEYWDARREVMTAIKELFPNE